MARWAEISIAPWTEGEDCGRYHARLLSMCQETLKHANCTAQETAAAAAREVEAQEATLRVKQSGQEAAEAALEKARARAAAAAEHFREKEAAAVREVSVAAAEEQKWSEFRREYSSLKRQRDEVAELMTGILPRLLEGSDPLTADGRIARIAEVEAFLLDADADPTLVAASREALILVPAARGTFDSETLRELEAVIAARLAELDAALEAKSHGDAEAEAEIMGAQALLYVTRKRASEAAGAVADAEAAVVEAMSARAEAEEAVAVSEGFFKLAVAAQKLPKRSAEEVAEALAVVTTIKPNIAGA